MSSNSGHLLDALRGRQPEDDDPEQRLASQWRAAAESTAEPVLDEAALRRARQRRVVSSAAHELAPEEPVPSVSATEVEAGASGMEGSEVKRTRITAAPEATRPQADAPRRGALERLGGMGRAVAAGFGGGRERHAEVAGDTEPLEPQASPSSRLARDRQGRGRVTLSHSEAMLFVLVALIVVLSAYVVGKNNADETSAHEKLAPLQSNRVAEDNEGTPSVPDPIVTPQPEPKPGPVELRPSGGFGVRVTSYADKDEADRQAQVFRSELAAGQEVVIVTRNSSSGREEHHLMVGRFEKKDDPALAALFEKFRTFRRGSLRPYERSVVILGY